MTWEDKVLDEILRASAATVFRTRDLKEVLEKGEGSFPSLEEVVIRKEGEVCAWNLGKFLSNISTMSEARGVGEVVLKRTTAVGTHPARYQVTRKRG